MKKRTASQGCPLLYAVASGGFRLPTPPAIGRDLRDRSWQGAAQHGYLPDPAAGWRPPPMAANPGCCAAVTLLQPGLQ